MAGAVVHCSVGLDIRDGAAIVCAAAPDCPDNYDCVNGVCVPRNGNQAPVVTLAPIASSKDVIVIAATVFDADSDVSTVEVLLGEGAGAVELGLFAEVAATPDGAPIEMVWDAAAHFAGLVSRAPDLVVTLVPRDAFRIGTPVVSAPFTFGNAPPRLTGVSVDTAEGLARGDVSVSITIVDDDEAVSVSRFTLHSGGSSVDVALGAAAFPSGGLSGIRALPGGTTHTLVWRSGVDAPIAASDVEIEVEVTDAFGDSASATTAPFVLNNAPSVSADLALGAGSRFVNAVSMDVVVDDPNADLVDVEIEYRVDAGPWQAATVAALSDPVTAVSPNLATAPYRLVWDVAANAGTDPALPSADLDTDGDGLAQEEVVAYREGVELRLRAVEPAPSTLASDWRTLGPIALGDDPPSIELLPVADAKRSVAVPFVISDSTADTVDIELEFCWPALAETCALDATAATDGWKVAALDFGSLVGVPSGAGVERVVSWNSDAPEPLGMGDANADSVQLRARVHDRVDGATTVYGTTNVPDEPWSTVTTGSITNQTPPRIVGVQVRRLGVSGGVSPIAIDYDLIDDETDVSDIDCTFSHDLSTRWTRCAEYRGADSEGRYDLATAPLDIAGAGGVRHRFVWDPSGQWVSAATTTLRLSASDGRGGTTNVDTVLARPVTGLPSLPQIFGRESPTHLIDEGYGPGGSLVGLVAHDFDRDGRLDVAAAYEAGSVRVFLGVIGADGTGTFTSSSYGVGPLPVALVGGDFDGNGLLDLATANRGGMGGGALSILLGDGGGGFTSGEVQFVFISDPPRALVAKDLNDDGRDDLVVVVQRSFAAMESGLMITYGSQTPAGVSGSIVYGDELAVGDYRGVTAADIDGDAVVDVALLSNNELAIILGDGSGGLLTEDIDTYPIVANSQGGLGDIVAPCDLDADGTSELLVAGDDGAQLFRNDGAGVLVPEQLTDQPATFVHAADVSGDGLDDVIVGRAAGPPQDGVFMLLGDGAGGLQLPFLWFDTQNTDKRVTRVQAGPSGGDLAPDLFFAMTTGDGNFQQLRRFVGAYRGSFPSDGTYSAAPSPDELLGASSDLVLPATFTGAAVVADLEHDGNVDLVVGAGLVGGDDTALLVLRGSGETATNQPGLELIATVPTLFRPIALATGDFDGDGTADLVAAGAGASPSVSVYLGDGAGTFASGTDLAEPTWETPVALAVADLDGDGHRDLVAALTSADVALFRGLGTGGFVTPAELLGTGVHGETTLRADLGYEPRGLGVCDLDSDGRLDLVVTNNGATADGSGSLSVFLGEAGGTMGPAIPFQITAGTRQVWDSGLGWIDVPVIFKPYAVACADLNRDGLADVVTTGWTEPYPGKSADHGYVRAGQGRRSSSDWTLGAQGSFLSPAEAYSLALADLNLDGVLEPLPAGPRGYILPTATLAVDPQQPAQPHLLVSADIDNDQQPDVVVLNAATSRLTVFSPHVFDREPWRLVMRPDEGMIDEIGYTPPDLVSTALDRFNRLRGRPVLSWHRAAAAPGGVVDVVGALRQALPVATAGAAPLTHAWQVAGDIHLARRVVSGSGDQRSRVRAAFGPPVVGDPDDGLERLGLSLAADPPRGIIVPLPIESRWSSSQINDGTVRVFAGRALHRVDATAPPHIPRLEVGDGTFLELAGRDLIWEEIDEDVDGDFASGSGERFVVTFAAGGSRQVRVLTDRLGTFVALLVNP